METKRIVLAVALSFLTIGLYQTALDKMYPHRYDAQRAKLAQKADNPAKEIQNTATFPETTAAQPSLAAIPAIPDTQDVEFQNQKLVLLYDTKGAGFRKIAFKEFNDSETKKPLLFLSLDPAKSSVTAVDLILPGGSVIRDSYSLVKESSSSHLKAVTGFAEGHQGIKVSRNYSFNPGGYDAKLELTFHNVSKAPIELQYKIYAGSSLKPRHSIDSQYLEANFYHKESDKFKIRHINETGAGKVVKSSVPLEWLAIKDRHFSTILKPENNTAFFGVVEGLGDHHFQAALMSQKKTIPAGSSITENFVLYMGPNELETLTPLGLEPLVNFGKLDGIGRLLVGALELINKLVHNYGIAIILLTFLINVIFFPFTRLSYMSMKRMQLVQPQMSKLREQNKNNPEKLNREMMELYKKHKVNPFGGCLPMLLQMPVFIALYVALSKSVILINAKFLWVNDLSSPDNVPLPFTLPMIGNQLHVLPLIMVGAMVVQQKFTQIKIEGQDPAMESQQKMMATMMPIIFGFIFYSMPSSLVLYWLTNTLLMTGYQLSIKKVTL